MSEKSMNKHRLCGIISLAAAVALELLPVGAVCCFAVAPEAGGGYIRETYSYFDPLVFGYANFGPLITAILSCVLLTLWIYGAVFESEGKYFGVMTVLSVIALAASLFPVLLGIKFYSIIGCGITLLMLVSGLTAGRCARIRTRVCQADGVN